jgi:anti-sigma B factor antagonist
MAANPVFPEAELRFRNEPAQNLNILHCEGRIVSSTVPLLKDEVAALISKDKHIVLDLTKVDYIDSSGLGAIVSAYTGAKRVGRELRVINLMPRVKELFSLTRLSTVLEGNGEYFGITPD